MADLQHSTLPNSALHEPKHIGINGISSSGKVITNSSSTSGQSEYRRLKGADIEEIQEELMVLEVNATTAQTHYIPTTFSGTITKLRAIVNAGLATGSNSYVLQIAGVPVTGSALTLTTTSGTGGDPGDIVESTPSAANTFNAGQALTVNNTAVVNSNAAVNVRFVISVTRD